MLGQIEACLFGQGIVGVELGMNIRSVCEGLEIVAMWSFM